MLTGRELGDAITAAIKLKLASGAVASKKEIAEHFGVKPPSIHDWMKKGSIGKEKLPELFEYFSDVVGPEHWGINKDSYLWTQKKHNDEDGSISKEFDDMSLKQEQFIRRMIVLSKELSDDELQVVEDGTVATSNALKTKRNTKTRKRKQDSKP